MSAAPPDDNHADAPAIAARPRPAVVMFAYRRAGHLARTLEALRRNHGAADTDLIVYADGARGSDDAAAVAQVREVLRATGGFASVRVIEREANLGLARSVIEGVTATLAQYPEAVVLEEDMLTSPHFLDYMRDGLDRYAGQERVASIHAYLMQLPGPVPETFFLRGADCWGWATWRRAWRGFEPDGRKLLCELERRGLCAEFDFNGAYPYTRMLRDAIDGRVDSWAILWHASAFLQDQLTLHPGHSLIQNIGNDGSGQHGGNSAAYAVALDTRPVHVGEIPIEECRAMWQQVARFHAGSGVGRGFWARAASVLRARIRPR